MRRLISSTLSALLLAACGPEKNPPAEEEVFAGPTYHQTVAPILSRNCNGCHVQGGIAPFALDTAEQAEGMSTNILKAVESRAMPPWPPSALSPEFEHDRRLSDDEIATIKEWVANGAPMGNPDRAVELPGPEVVALTTVSVEKDIGADYVPDASANDDYRCFLVDLDVTSPRIATAYEVVPGNRRTVHHVIAYQFNSGDKQALMDADAASPERAGFECFGGPSPSGTDIDPVGVIGGWVPGQTAVKFTPGSGKQIPAGSVLVMQVHYNLLGGQDPDRTKIRMTYAQKAAEPSLQPLYTVPFYKGDIRLPPNQENIVQERTKNMLGWTGNLFFPDNDAFLVSVAGHMHRLGRSIRLTLKRPDGTEQIVLDIPKWSFNWQGTYQLKAPIKVGPEDTITISCAYDNTEAKRLQGGFVTPMREVTWGEGTEDEMCLAYVDISDQDPLRRQ